MYDFLNRVDAQRMVLDSVNRQPWEREPLMSLSRKSIDRWVECNLIDRKSELVSLLFITSEKLFFLANKSQEQITEDYKSLSREVADLSFKIRKAAEMYC